MRIIDNGAFLSRWESRGFGEGIGYKVLRELGGTIKFGFGRCDMSVGFYTGFIKTHI